MNTTTVTVTAAEPPSCVVWHNDPLPTASPSSVLWCETHDETFWIGERCPYDRTPATADGVARRADEGGR